MMGKFCDGDQFFQNVSWTADDDDHDTKFSVPSYEKLDCDDYVINMIYVIYQDDCGKIYSRQTLLGDKPPKFQDNIAYFDYPGLRAVKSADFQVNNTSITKYTVEQGVADKEFATSQEYKPSYARSLGQEQYNVGYTYNSHCGSRIVTAIADGY